MGVVETFERVVDSLADEPEYQGLEIVKRSTRHAGASMELRLMIDMEGGVDVELCGNVARRVNDALSDEAGLYTLQVESAGLERPLVRPEDYDRFRGRLVCIKTHEPLYGAKTHRGRLDGRDGDDARIESENGLRRIPLAGIASAHLEFDLRAALRRDEPRKKRPQKERRKTT